MPKTVNTPKMLSENRDTIEDIPGDNGDHYFWLGGGGLHGPLSKEEFYDLVLNREFTKEKEPFCEG